jgi:hypothetical protein
MSSTWMLSLNVKHVDFIFHVDTAGPCERVQFRHVNGFSTSV